MKKILFVLIIIVVLIISFAIFKENIVLYIARVNIRKVLPQSKVEIKKIEFQPLSSLKFKGINIKSSLQGYSLYFGQVNIDYTIASILKGTINKINLDGMDILVRDNIKVNPGKPIFGVKQITATGSIKFRDIEIKNFQANFYQAEDVKRPKIKLNGNLNVEGINKKKIKVSHLSLTIDFQPDALEVPEFRFSAFGGEIRGKIEAFFLKSGINFFINLNGENIDLAQLNEDFDLKERFEVTGRCDFVLEVKGDNKGLLELDGNLTTQAGGGKFVVTDKQALGRIALAKETSLDLALESLKNYHYDKGSAKIYLEDGNIVLHMLMDGPLGARDLTVVYHQGAKFK
ncbi:MAG: YdbH domain-containing protein [Candidatus Omnitrophica bacterium]|nr:YdbH domain-containing protein [Candidatus Omnitrophota bacterium]